MIRDNCPFLSQLLLPCVCDCLAVPINSPSSKSFALPLPLALLFSYVYPSCAFSRDRLCSLCFILIVFHVSSSCCLVCFCFFCFFCCFCCFLLVFFPIMIVPRMRQLLFAVLIICFAPMYAYCFFFTSLL